jgi:hypothetical protein
MTPDSTRTADRDQIRKLSITGQRQSAARIAGTTSPGQHCAHVELRGIRLDRDPPIRKEPGYVKERSCSRFSRMTSDSKTTRSR